MSYCTAQQAVDYAKSQKGTKEKSGNWNIYAKMLDEAKPLSYFYPQKKQGQPWCCIYVDACIYVACGNDKAKADHVLYQPAKENYSAVVSYLAGYFKKNNAYFADKNKVAIGDVIFFNSVDSKGKVTSTYSHTGLVIEVSATGVKTSEGNSGDKVSEHSYNFSLIGTRIAGFGRPRYDKEPTPTPPSPTPTDDRYQVVNIKTFLAIRSSAENLGDKNKVGELYNGAIVSVSEIKGSWARISSGLWVSKTYLKKL